MRRQVNGPTVDGTGNLVVWCSRTPLQKVNCLIFMAGLSGLRKRFPARFAMLTFQGVEAISEALIFSVGRDQCGSAKASSMP